MRFAIARAGGTPGAMASEAAWRPPPLEPPEVDALELEQEHHRRKPEVGPLFPLRFIS